MATSDGVVGHENRGRRHRRKGGDNLLRAAAARGGAGRDGGGSVRRLLLGGAQGLVCESRVRKAVKGRRSGLGGDDGSKDLGGHFDPFLPHSG